MNKKANQDFWKNVPKVDATEPLIIHPQRSDLESAVPGDPENCIYAKCIRRVFPTARRIRIWRSIALIEGKDKKGQPIATRYVISEPSRKALINFDKGVGEPKPCILIPPSPRRALETMRREYHKEYQKTKEHKNLRQKEKRAGLREPATSTAHLLELGIRDGTGHSYSIAAT